MYYINKIVGWAMSPIGVLFLGMGGAWMLGVLTQRHRGTEGRGRILGRLRRWVLGLTLMVFWILGCGVTTRVIGVPLEGEEAPEAQGVGSRVEGLGLRVEGVDAIVLLGGGMGAHKKCGRAEMFGGADRVWHAAKLWALTQRHRGTEIVPITLSGGGVEQSTVPLLMDLGVPREAMTFFPEARNTEEEAGMIREFLTQRGDFNTEAQGHREDFEGPAALGRKPRVLLVTSAWHMSRAKMLFERAGLEVVEAPCDYEMHYSAEKAIEVGDFFPSADALARNSWAIKEWVARFCYWLKG